MEDKTKDIQNTEDSEILFENKYTATKELYKEVVKMTFQPISSYFMWFMAAICFLLTVIYISAAFERGKLEFLDFAIIALTILLILIVPIQRYRVLKMTIRQEKTMNNGKMGEHNNKFYSDRLENIKGTIIPYSNITKIRKGKGCIVLIINKAVVITIKKGAFTKGNNDEFMKFIQDVVNRD